MAKCRILGNAPKGFKGSVKFFHKNLPFGVFNIKEPLKDKIPFYIFLFKLMEDQYKDQPDLQMHKFGEIFQASMLVNGKKKTEQQIEDLFGNQFTVTIKHVG